MKRTTDNPAPEINDDTPVSSINALATLIGEGDGTTVDTLDNLAGHLAEIVSAPMESIQFYGPHNGTKAPEIPGDRKVPNILTGSSKCSIRLERSNGLALWLKFPSTVGTLDRRLLGLGKQKTADEADLDEFTDRLVEELDGFGHLSYTVGNEDWLACADASLGRFNGKLYLATHVVVDCESGGFVDTIETNVEEIDPSKPAPRGLLSCYLDNCWEQYAHEQYPDPLPDGYEKDEDTEHLQIDQEDCLKAIKDFDDLVARMWAEDPDTANVDYDWDDDPETGEQEEALDPVGNGWVGCDGRP